MDKAHEMNEFERKEVVAESLHEEILFYKHILNPSEESISSEEYQEREQAKREYLMKYRELLHSYKSLLNIKSMRADLDEDLNRKRELNTEIERLQESEVLLKQELSQQQDRSEAATYKTTAEDFATKIEAIKVENEHLDKSVKSAKYSKMKLEKLQSEQDEKQLANCRTEIRTIEKFLTGYGEVMDCSDNSLKIKLVDADQRDIIPLIILFDLDDGGQVTRIQSDCPKLQFDGLVEIYGGKMERILHELRRKWNLLQESSAVHHELDYLMTRYPIDWLQEKNEVRYIMGKTGKIALFKLKEAATDVIEAYVDDASKTPLEWKEVASTGASLRQWLEHLQTASGPDPN